MAYELKDIKTMVIDRVGYGVSAKFVPWCDCMWVGEPHDDMDAADKAGKAHRREAHPGDCIRQGNDHAGYYCGTHLKDWPCR